ncbi:hypothetical protein EHI8A_001390 [Entamoeba histolytica HM-1:IMSS-B]|uniref:Uncharacterized protein n=6 Tax=Entamoeba histolytica TaxID=5759 RepID=C4LVQ6_ENTH1|nr:hypothetical protein EHI_186890 [Entamoeba histolytica HM-1:IMSS]EMD46780.1 Hypothetical protein EHI5A_006060 [Entamoeba histolytica KU27]EMH78085.1 hypothetical protein EHI8A_001390 [Entamoeba histolytica HM-1:IMSS-B]EMS14202.1 hypothetical protein KM1_008790 [Entamoeba histolytica HM-3:IMSS]ENY63339.1 hypothetical protein EHI7A_010460 [Entamoeba histolytica HM-1:IMSS-A]GAT92760.1 hypothetical protein CL6EHI_186890 [Entamoeba histolytica]|eukprot:XP_656432.1 hypothetical protein EHI_186890 [Entamoeba histolytica HM-1:IMSS]
MQELMNALQANGNETIDRIRKIEERLDSQQQIIEKLTLENRNLHHLLFSIIKTRLLEIDDVYDDDIDSQYIEKMIGDRNQSLSMFGVSSFNYINEVRKVDKPLKPITPEILIACYKLTENESEKTSILCAIAKNTKLEYSTSLCDILVSHIGDSNEVNEDLAIDAFCSMKCKYKNEQLILNLCQCLIETPNDNLTKKMKLAYLILRYSEIEDHYIRKAMFTSGIIEYICEDYLSLQQCGSLGVLLLVIKNLLDDQSYTDFIPFECVEAIIHSPLWYEDFQDNQWKQLTHFEPFSLLKSLCSSPIQRNVISRSGLLEDIFEHIDVDNKDCLLILLELNKICPQDVVDYTEIIKEAMKDHQEDKEYLQTATHLLCAIALSQSSTSRQSHLETQK